jgi:hypothetical protein
MDLFGKPEKKLPSWHTMAGVFLLVIAAAVVASLFTSGCSKNWNDPWPTPPTPTNPCGNHWLTCGNGKCCPEDHVCRPGYCAYVGDSFGAAQDGGVPQRTPDQVPR